MPARLVLIARVIAILIILLAIALIIIRWRFPSTAQPDGSTRGPWRELWRRWLQQQRIRRERHANLRALKGKTALIVDPDDKSARVLSWWLGNVGVRGILCRTGSSGLTRAESDRPDVVFADALLPDMSAFDFHTQLQKPGLPIVFLGALDSQANALRSLGPSVGCLAKPYDPDDAAVLAGSLLRLH